MADPTWTFWDPACKPRLLQVLEREAHAFVDLVATPDHWHTPTACEGWTIGDMAGHLVDATEEYLRGFEAARGGTAVQEPVGMAGMAAAVDEAARSFRGTPPDELLSRLRSVTTRVLEELGALTDDEWTNLSVADRYLGPLPAMAVAAGLLSGYTVHSWDVREGLGASHAIDADAADLLVPFVFAQWRATADTSAVRRDFDIGIRTTGSNGGDTWAEVTNQGVRFAHADISNCDATLEMDPATLVLVAAHRINSGTARGDREVLASFHALFVQL